MVRRVVVVVCLVGLTVPFQAVSPAWAGDICRFPPRVVARPGDANVDPALAPWGGPTTVPLRPIAQCYEVALGAGASFPEDLVLHDGYLYVTGGTGRDDPADDVFVAKLRASDGAEQWRQVIDIGGADDGYAVRVGADGFVYVAGVANDYEDGFLASLDPDDGAVLWTTLIATTSKDQAHGLAPIGDGVYVVGYTTGDLDPDDGVGPAGGRDLFLALYDLEGNQIWGVQRGTGVRDQAGQVEADEAGNAYIVGYTGGSLYGTFHGGSYDFFAARYAPDGTLDWGLQEGTGGSDFGYAIELAPDGYLYVAGGTGGDLFGTNNGSYDYFLARYDQDGTRDDAFAFQGGSSDQDFASYLEASSGRLYVAGMTDGDLFGASRGSTDVFLAEHDPSADPGISWSKHAGGPSDDYVTGLALDEEGSRLFVSGMNGAGYIAMFALR